jgi:hypothetical protein
MGEMNRPKGAVADLTTIQWGDVYRRSLEELDDDDALLVYALTDIMKKASDDRGGELKERIRAIVLAKGKATKSGKGAALTTPQGQFTVVTPDDTVTVNSAKLLAVLKELEIDPSKVFDVRTVPAHTVQVLNEGRLEALLEENSDLADAAVKFIERSAGTPRLSVVSGPNGLNKNKVLGF